MAFVAALFYFGGRRSETLAGIGGPARDESWERIDVHATAMAGLVLVVVIIGCWLVEVTQGRDGRPFTELGTVGGLAYIGPSRSCAGGRRDVAARRLSLLWRKAVIGVMRAARFTPGEAQCIEFRPGWQPWLSLRA